MTTRKASFETSEPPEPKRCKLNENIITINKTSAVIEFNGKRTEILSELPSEHLRTVMPMAQFADLYFRKREEYIRRTVDVINETSGHDIVLEGEGFFKNQVLGSPWLNVFIKDKIILRTTSN